jgi:hypothetical protein
VNAGTCFDNVEIGGYGARRGCATLTVACSSSSRHARSLDLDVLVSKTGDASLKITKPIMAKTTAAKTSTATLAGIAVLAATVIILTVVAVVVAIRQRQGATQAETIAELTNLTVEA